MRSSERSQISNFLVMNVMRHAASLEAAGRKVLHMEVGQPATPAPKTAIETAKRALNEDAIGYTLALGLPSLRQRIAKYYRDVYNQNVDAERIIITSGSSAGFVLAFLALFDPGQSVALPSPGYPCYRHILTALGQKTPLLATGPAGRWMPERKFLEDLHADQPLAGLVLASPANPTGTMISAQRLADITAFCSENHVWLISDEIYHGLTYEGDAQTALAASDAVIVVNSFSKYFSMTGWRIGWLVVPEPLVATFERLAQNFYISPPTLSQIAAEAAFDGIEELKANRSVYARNREKLLAGLTDLGVHDYAPADGAFYVYADISHLSENATEFARQMLQEINVAVTPGVDFDAEEGHRFIRFCYAGAAASIDRALDRMHAWPRWAG